MLSSHLNPSPRLCVRLSQKNTKTRTDLSTRFQDELSHENSSRVLKKVSMLPTHEVLSLDTHSWMSRQHLLLVHTMMSTQMSSHSVSQQVKCFREASKKAKPILLEPVMKVEINTPEEYMGDILGDVNGKRGQINEMGDRGMAKIIQAHISLSQRCLDTLLLSDQILRVVLPMRWNFLTMLQFLQTSQKKSVLREVWNSKKTTNRRNAEKLRMALSIQFFSSVTYRPESSFLEKLLSSPWKFLHISLR
jgi:hypothetical protein